MSITGAATTVGARKSAVEIVDVSADGADDNDSLGLQVLLFLPADNRKRYARLRVIRVTPPDEIVLKLAW